MSLVYIDDFFAQGKRQRTKEYEKHDKSKVKPVETLYTSKRTAPEENIKKIGKMGESATPKQLQVVMNDYISSFNKKIGKNILIFDC